MTGSGRRPDCVMTIEDVAEKADVWSEAIKKIVKAFEHRVFALRTYRELKIQRLMEHENVLGIKRILKPRNKETFNEIYVVTELMETDLGVIIKSGQALSDDHI